MIIGLTGKNGAGKGEAAEILKSLNFHYLSLSDVLRDELAAAGKEITRENLIHIGNRLRTEHGPAVLAETILGRLEADKNYVIDSFRNPSEARAFQKRKDFILLHISATPEIRFTRLKTRARESDPGSFEQFVALEKREAAGDVNAQNLDGTIALATLTLENNTTREALRAQVIEIVKELSRASKRPDWDEYFMGIARVVALRSNCIKRKVASVIAKDKRIISTGYNGTPRGVKNCSEGGCPRCNDFTASGTRLDECLCSHAEENAITQSAYHGV
ncbi:MAG: AAA family ATPase, partial [Candidatus Omnitrophica bacterium]|nr:AAA family ATPase [Candidatus Omnitrophota bacterium]